MKNGSAIRSLSGAQQDAPWAWSTPMPFLERRFPFRILVFFPALKKILPPDVFLYFQGHYKSWLWDTFCRELGEKLGGTVRYERVRVPHGMGSTYRLVRAVLSIGTKAYFSFGRSLISEDDALSKALGELLERYMCRNTEGARIGPMKTQFSRMFLESSPLYYAWQKEEANGRFVTKMDISGPPLLGVEVRSLLGRQKANVPIARVFFDHEMFASAPLTNQPTSNGGGAGFTRSQANLSACYELIERDSFMCFWLLGLVPRRIDVATIPFARVREYVESSKVFGITTYFLDVTTSFGVPCVCTVATRTDSGGKIRVSIGCAAGFSYEKVFENSLLESLTMLRVSEVTMNEVDDSLDAKLFESKPFSEKRIDKDARSRFWGRGHAGEKIIPFVGGGFITFQQFAGGHQDAALSDEDELGHLKNTFESVISRLGAGYHPFVYEARSRVLSRYGYFVSKAVVASLFPLYLSEHMATLDITALKHWKETAEKMGVAGDLQVVNTTPHPFL